VWCLSTGTETLVYDLTTNCWTEFKSYGLNEWRAHLGAPRGDGRVIAGDSVNGKLWLLDPDGSNDATDPIERTFSGRIQRTGAPLPMANLILDCTGGTASTGDPVVQVATSDDGGHTWTSWRDSYLGAPRNIPGWCAGDGSSRSHARGTSSSRSRLTSG
jgi:hypothetical protein